MIAAFDVGGSSIKAGLVQERHQVGDVTMTRLDHRADHDPLIDRFVAAVRSLPATDRLAFAIPDPFDHTTGTSLMEHKFAALHGVRLLGEIRDRLGEQHDIRSCNDAAAAVMGEAVAGAGTDHGRVFGITLGTGLGAAFVVDGALVEEVSGIVPGNLWAEPHAGTTADELFSARAFMARVATADDGEREAATFGADLAEFLAPRLERVDADLLIIGGGGSRSFDRFGPAIGARLPIPVEVAVLGRAAPLVGAAEICFS